MSRTYSRDDVQFHSDGYGRESNPAVNVKVYTGLRDCWKEFARDELPDPRFTLDWIEDNASAEHLDAIFWSACEAEFEYLEGWVTGSEGDSLFPGHRVTLEREGRSGRWAVVHGLPELEEWDAVLLARWRKFERIAKEIAAGIPYQMLSSLYINDFEIWANEREDESDANTEVDVAEGLANHLRVQKIYAETDTSKDGWLTDMSRKLDAI